MTEITITDNVPDELADRLRDLFADLSEITVENRQYGLREDELPDGQEVFRDRDDLPYVVDGERQLFSEFAADVDGEDVFVAAQSHIRKSNWKEQGKDYAALAYDVMEEHGIERPAEDPHVGVQFGTLPDGTLGETPEPTVHAEVPGSRDVVAVENRIRGGAQ